MGDIERLLEIIREQYDYEGSNFEVIKKSVTFIRYRWYSDSSGKTHETEVGFTEDDKRYEGHFGIYERYRNRSSVEPYNWDSEVLKNLCDKYCAQRTSFNFYTAWFYWHLTGRVLEEVWETIVISEDPIDFFSANPELVLPNTREAMTDRCIEEIPKIQRIHNLDSKYFSGYYDGEGILGEDKVFEEASSCDDDYGKPPSGRIDVERELMSIPKNELDKKLRRAMKEAINHRLAELKAGR